MALAAFSIICVGQVDHDNENYYDDSHGKDHGHNIAVTDCDYDADHCMTSTETMAMTMTITTAMAMIVNTLRP